MNNTEDNWNEEEGILTLEEFKPVVPVSVSLGIEVAKDPVKREKLKAVFIDVFRSTGNVVDAAKICQIPKSLAYTWRKQDPEFAYRWDQVTKTDVLPHLEAEAIRRALNGSDLMLIFMLKALDREKYDDKAAEKRQNVPSITIKMVDVDNVAIAVANGSDKTVPAVNYVTGEVINGQKALPAVVEGQVVNGSRNSNEPIAGAKGASTK
jgi:hypothetical protein